MDVLASTMVMKVLAMAVVMMAGGISTGNSGDRSIGNGGW